MQNHAYHSFICIEVVITWNLNSLGAELEILSYSCLCKIKADIDRKTRIFFSPKSVPWTIKPVDTCFNNWSYCIVPPVLCAFDWSYLLYIYIYIYILPVSGTC